MVFDFVTVILRINQCEVYIAELLEYVTNKVPYHFVCLRCECHNLKDITGKLFSQIN